MTETERRQRERKTSYLTMIRFSSLCAVGRDSLPVGCQNLRVPALLAEGRVRSGYRRGKVAVRHPSYKFGDSWGQDLRDSMF